MMILHWSLNRLDKRFEHFAIPANALALRLRL
jgi:hypothetical protein